jgi:hypothetical protein
MTRDNDELIEAAIYHRMAEVLYDRIQIAPTKAEAIATIEAFLHDAGRRGFQEGIEKDEAR